MRRGQPNPTLHTSTCLLIKSNVQQSETTQAAATQYKYRNISMSFQSWQFSALHRWNFERAHACHASSRYTHAWVAWVLLAITGEGRRCSGILGIYMEQILEIQKLTVSAKLPLQQSCKKIKQFFRCYICTMDICAIWRYDIDIICKYDIYNKCCLCVRLNCYHTGCFFTGTPLKS